MNLSTLSVIYRNGLWISAPLFCISAVLLGFFILNVVRLVKKAHILSVPLLEQQDVEFVEAGRVVLCLEGPRLSGRFAGLDYELSAVDGTPVKGRTTWFHAKTSGLSKVRMEMRIYEIPEPGCYVLRVQGLGAARAADAKHRVVFMRPHLVQALGYVIGMTLAAGLLIASFVFFVLRLTSNGSINGDR
jgi:hypothetical protein